MLFLSNLYVNRMTLSRAGRTNSLFAIVHHVGRKSGQEYRSPVMAQKVGKWFVVPLPYGDDVHWCRNVFAASQCTIDWRGHSYTASAPRLLTAEVVSQRLSRWQRGVQSMFGTKAYLMMRASDPRESQ